MVVVDCSILILSYRNKKYLEDLLPTVESLIANSPKYTIEVIIVENGNDKDSELFVSSQYPNYQFIFCSNNFLFSFNPVVKELKSEFIFVLNNDLKLHKDVLNYSLPLLINDPGLFAVSCTLMNWEGTNIQYNRSSFSIKNGWLYINNKPEEDDKEQHGRYIFYACGGAAIYRTKMFNALNGFDPIYSPAYYEDTDLSHRAWHNGWKIINHPDAIVYHYAGGSWKNLKKENALMRLQQRNRIIGMVSNLRGTNLLLFFLFLPHRILFNWKLGTNHYLGLLAALPRIPYILFHHVDKKPVLMNDAAIMRLCDQKYDPGISRFNS